jgi:molecular chaperone HtpG
MSAETFTFQAETNQLMSLIINSLYSNKDIFLRELISNASDAIDKIRHANLQDSSVPASSQIYLIQIIPDKVNKTLTIRDTGVGMTKNDLVNNLGTIAKSGTKHFMEELKKASGTEQMKLIGQFGVGFYSAYLVADTVKVITKHTDDVQYVWESSAGSSYTVQPVENPDSSRGTSIVLYLKPDQLHYLEESTITDIVKKHSEFINYPIELQVQREVETESVPEESDQTEKDPNEVTVEDIPEDGDKAQSTTKQTVTEFNQLNKTKPIWTRNPDEITADEYTAFYKSISNDYDDHLALKHFSLEGQLEFKGIIFVPKRAPFDMFQREKTNNLKLYVRKVFITDDCKELCPEYLSFIKGVIDSEDLPLNVSREILQQNKSMTQMSKALVTKCIQLFTELAEDETKYKIFYENYSKNIKLGVHSDSKNRDKLVDLLRYQTSRSDAGLVSFKQYVEKMPTHQTDIYFITGETKQAVINHPLVSKLGKLGFEVIFMTEAIDEYALQQMSKYDGKNLVNITKEGLKLPETDEQKAAFELKVKTFETVCSYMKSVLSFGVERVKVSPNLDNIPCSLLTGQYGHSANMERILRAQPMQAEQNPFMMGMSKKIMEINPDHPLVELLKTKISEVSEETKSFAKNLSLMLYETAMISGGFSLVDPNIYSQRVYDMLSDSLGLKVVPNTDLIIPEETEPEDYLEDDSGDDDDEHIDEIPDDQTVHAESVPQESASEQSTNE